MKRCLRNKTGMCDYAKNAMSGRGDQYSLAKEFSITAECQTHWYRELRKEYFKSKFYQHADCDGTRDQR